MRCNNRQPSLIDRRRRRVRQRLFGGRLLLLLLGCRVGRRRLGREEDGRGRVGGRRGRRLRRGGRRGQPRRGDRRRPHVAALLGRRHLHQLMSVVLKRQVIKILIWYIIG